MLVVVGGFNPCELNSSHLGWFPQVAGENSKNGLKPSSRHSWNSLWFLLHMFLSSAQKKSAFCFEMKVHEKKKKTSTENYTLYPLYPTMQKRKWTCHLLTPPLHLKSHSCKRFTHKAVIDEDPGKKKMGEGSQLNCDQFWVVSLACSKKKTFRKPPENKV